MSTSLEAYLEYYCGLENPKFAVLVAGPWGAGKTFQVRRALDSIASRRAFKSDPLNPDDPIWISLYGVDTPAALDVAIVAASDRSSHLGIGGLKMIGNLSRGIGGFFAAGAIASELARPILRRSIASSRHRILVFDDLERCPMSMDVMLGSINFYVEQLGFRAILIAHDAKIESELSSRKEKLVGQTLRVSPNYNEAFDYFVFAIESLEARQFVSEHREDILFPYVKGGVQSLRILKHSILDVARLRQCLDSDQVQHETAISQLLQVFCSLGALLREGLLSSSDLDQRMEKYVSYHSARRQQTVQSRGGENVPDTAQNDSLRSGIARAFERFEGAGVILASKILDDGTLKATLVDGVFDSEQIQHCLETGGYFGSRLEARSWWRVWHWSQRSDEDVIADIEDMERDFADRSFVEHGEIMHMFGLRLKLANDGFLLNLSLETVAAQSKSYIDDLLKQGKLVPDTRHMQNDALQLQDDTMGAFGLGYYGSSEEATKKWFVELGAYLSAARQKALQATYPQAAEQLLALLRCATDESISDFEGELAGAEGHTAGFAHLPIFSHQSVEPFFDAILQLDGVLFERVLKALRRRYDGVALQNGLDDELDWILGVLAHMEKSAGDPELRPVKRQRSKMFLERFDRRTLLQRKKQLMGR